MLGEEWCLVLGRLSFTHYPLPFRMNNKKKGKSVEKSLGLECGLEIPKFLREYKNLLSEDSVFRKSMRKELETGFEEEEKPAVVVVVLL